MSTTNVDNVEGEVGNSNSGQEPVSHDMSTPRVPGETPTTGAPPTTETEEPKAEETKKKPAFPFSFSAAEQQRVQEGGEQVPGTYVPPPYKPTAPRAEDVDYIKHLHSLKQDADKLKEATDKSAEDPAAFGIREGMVQARITALDAIR